MAYEQLLKRETKKIAEILHIDQNHVCLGGIMDVIKGIHGSVNVLALTKISECLETQARAIRLGWDTNTEEHISYILADNARLLQENIRLAKLLDEKRQ